MHADLIAAFLIGLAGSVHCVSMCGGVVAGLSFAIPKDKNKLPFIATYNIGRISSYSLAGGITGAFGGIFSHQIQNGIVWLNLISGVFLILVAAYIGGWWRILSHLEKAGGKLWKHISPIGKRFVPFKSPIYALPYGILWGWLPCGLVYSALTWSLASGSWLDGALTMMFFGAGTLPSVILLALSGKSLAKMMERPQTKQIMAILICLFGIYSISKSLPDIL